ncbi:MAG: YceI family protein [Spirobacillus cienkowskii]|uniref:YceI family protein n=1 Tax=Spirobacillus cienkowskii TaxID=495820 RepID=A0A369KV53_9BACT|nr:MAG: YceI family protein [Spirobacillus cienkowskii]
MIKQSFYSLFLLSSFIMFPAFSFNTEIDDSKMIALAQSAQSYKVDPLHSKVTFEVAHLVISTVNGEFKKFEGNFKFNPDNFSQSQLDASVETNSIDTAVQKRDDHLKSPDFFDTKKFPKMTFKSKSAKKTSSDSFDLMGDLTIRGVTKPITFKVKYKGQIKSKDKTIQAFKAVAEINRKDFGMSFQNIAEAGPVVGDVVTISLVCEGINS